MEFDPDSYNRAKALRQNTLQNYHKRFKHVQNQIDTYKQIILDHNIFPNRQIIHQNPSIHSHHLQKQPHIHHQIHHHQPQSHNHHHNINSNTDQQQYSKLVQQYKHIQSQILRQQSEFNKQSESLRQQLGIIQKAHTVQMSKLAKISEKQQLFSQSKSKQLQQQIKNAQTKNIQIQAVNQTLKQQRDNAEAVYVKCLKQIQDEYQQKLKQFQTIIVESQDKISIMEKNFNQQDLLRTALANEKLMENLLQKSRQDLSNSRKQDFLKILGTKSEIIKNLMGANLVKEQQIKKLKELSQRFKGVFETLNKQKKELLEQNTKITQQLVDIRKIFNALLKRSGQQQQQQEEQQQQQNKVQQKEEANQEEKIQT